MQINKSQVINTPNFVAKSHEALGTPLQVHAQEQRTSALTREENQAKSSQVDSDGNAKQRFDVDEQTLALIEKEQLQPFNGRDTSHKHSNSTHYNTGYDTASNHNHTAVAAYQSVDAIAQRDNITQLFGVDLFA